MKDIIEITQVKNLAGELENQIIFNPTDKMVIFAYAWFTDSRFKGKSPEEVLHGIGLNRNHLNRWKKYNPHFEEWLEEFRSIHCSKDNTRRRQILDYVGMQKAMEGDFPFWKAMALKEKVIDPDQINHSIIPQHLGNFDALSQDEIEKYANSLLSSLNTVEDEGAIDLAGANLQRERQDNNSGTPNVSARPLALPDPLGDDREPSFAEDIDF